MKKVYMILISNLILYAVASEQNFLAFFNNPNQYQENLEMYSAKEPMPAKDNPQLATYCQNFFNRKIEPNELLYEVIFTNQTQQKVENQYLPSHMPSQELLEMYGGSCQIKNNKITNTLRNLKEPNNEIVTAIKKKVAEHNLSVTYEACKNVTNLYKILNIEQTASTQEIKTAYKKLCCYHPDKWPDEKRNKLLMKYSKK